MDGAHQRLRPERRARSDHRVQPVPDVHHRLRPRRAEAGLRLRPGRERPAAGARAEDGARDGGGRSA